MGSFVSLDLVLFFLFFELTLVPAYFLIAGWGFARRGYAAIKFFIYTFTGSAFLLVGILAVAFIHQSQTGVLTFELPALVHTHLSGTEGVLLFLAFTAAFAVKAPIFPFHTWSPDAYAEASDRRFGAAGRGDGQDRHLRDHPLRPQPLPPGHPHAGPVAVDPGGDRDPLRGRGGLRPARPEAAAGLLVAGRQIGFIVLGTFALNSQGLTGGVLQMVNHGLIIATLFIVVGWIYERRGTWQVVRAEGPAVARPR